MTVIIRGKFKFNWRIISLLKKVSDGLWNFNIADKCAKQEMLFIKCSEIKRKFSSIALKPMFQYF